MKGLYFKLKDNHHTYGLESINDDDCYHILKNYFIDHYDDYKWFLQSDSGLVRESNREYLFIEFIGEDLNDDTALSLCEKISKEIGFSIQGIN